MPRRDAGLGFCLWGLGFKVSGLGLTLCMHGPRWLRGVVCASVKKGVRGVCLCKEVRAWSEPVLISLFTTTFYYYSLLLLFTTV